MTLEVARMIFRFDSFELDTGRYELRNGGRPVPVEPKVFNLLAHFARHPERVFSRDELVDAVWAGRVVSDATVSTCIKNARKALGDSGGSQLYVRTVRGRGFRFCADVAEIEPGGDGAKGVPARDTPSRGGPDPSLLVMPFRAVPDEPATRALAEGLTFDLGSILTRVPLLRVRALNVGHLHAGVPLAARTMHEELGVDFVLEGSAQAPGSSLALNVQLCDARTGFSLWAERFVLPGPAAQALDGAVTAVVAKLEPRLHRAIYDAVRAAPGDPSARELYLQASAMLALNGWHHQSFQEAAGLLRRSRGLDPDFALAPAALSLVMGFGQRVGLMVDPDQARSEALDAAERALALDSQDATVLGFAGCALADIGHLERGTAILHNAVEIQPANGQAWAALGAACLALGKVDDAIRHLTHGIGISPLDSRLSIWGAILATAWLAAGDLDAALHHAELACQRNDRTYMPRVVLAAVHLQRGDPGRSRRALDDARRIHPGLSAPQIVALVGRRFGSGLLDPPQGGTPPP